MRSSSCFSPAHITGFFAVPEAGQDPLARGSIGAGVCLTKGVATRVSTTAGNSSRVEVTLNGVNTVAPVSRLVVQAYRKVERVHTGLKIDHRSDVPVGFGFGTSGAGALSLSSALNDLSAAGLSETEEAQIAHRAEAIAKTGLGTVNGILAGGLEARLKPGGPGIGETLASAVDAETRIVCLPIAGISTSRFLSNPANVRLSHADGKDLTSRLVRRMSIDNFMRLSQSFALASRIPSVRVRRIIHLMRRRKTIASMAMLGDTIFAAVDNGHERRVLDEMSRIAPGHSPFGGRIENREGGRFPVDD